jgi:membrane protein involved in colicin uptake
MVKKRRFWLYIVIAIVIIIAGILLYIFLRGKSQTLSNAGESIPAGEVPTSEEKTGIIEQIKNFFGGGSSSRGGSSGGGGGSGSSGGGSAGGGSSGTTTPEFSTDQTVCQNAQDGSLCDGLDVTYGGGYKTLCCSEHSLCC